MKLFKSHHPDFENGQQMRDFIYVIDIVKICNFLFENQKTVKPGIYNVGTGTARSFEDLANAVFDALGLTANISYIDMPVDIRENYQYYTRANIEKLKAQGYKHDLFSLEDGIEDYVKNYLFEKNYY